MNDTTENQAPQVAAAPRGPDFEAEREVVRTEQSYQSAVEVMNDIARSGFDGIRAVAQLVVLAMESPSFYGDGALMHDTMQVIQRIAEDASQCIRDEAHETGAKVDSQLDIESSKRRWRAMGSYEQELREEGA